MSILLLYGGVFVAILIIAIAFKLIKGLLKTVFFVFFLFVFFLFVTGFFVIRDVKNFQENFVVEENAYFMTMNDSVITGFSVEGNNFTSVNLFSDNELVYAMDNVNENVDSEYYKTIFIDYDIFEEFLDKGIDYEGITVDNKLATEIFDSADPLTVLAKSYDEKNWNYVRDKLSENYDDDSEVKSSIFTLILMESIIEDNNFFLNNIKSDDLTIQPETPLFTAIKYVPEELFEKFLTTNNTEEVLLNETEILGEGS